VGTGVDFTSAASQATFVSDPMDPQQPQSGLDRAAAADVRTVAKGGAVQIVGQVSQRLISFAFTALALEFLGRSAFGLYRQIAQVLSIAAQFGLAGFNYAAMRFITYARAQAEHGGVRGTARIALRATVIASLVSGLVLVGISNLLASYFADSPADESEFVRFLRIGAPYIPLFALMQVLRYCTQAYKTMVPSVVVGAVVQPVSRFVIGVGLLIAGFQVAGAVTSLVISVGLGAVVAGWYFRRMLTPEERAARPRGTAGPVVRFALPQAGASLFGIQSLGLGIILLGVLSTDSQVALFAVGLSLQGPANVFLGGVVNIWAPVVSDLHSRGEIARLDSLYKTINRWIATFSFPVLALLIIEPDPLTRIFFPKAHPGAIAVVAILAIGNIFYTGTGPTGYVISMTGHPGVNFINSIAAVALFIALGFVIVPDHGAIGMAIVEAIVTAVINTARVIEAWFLVGVQPFGRSYLKPLIATAAGAIVLLPLSTASGDNTWLELASIAVGAAVYVFVLSRLGIDAEERHVWERIRHRALKRGR
jgi:O-antigen/teichoic acid export membrane protein